MCYCYFNATNTINIFTTKLKIKGNFKCPACKKGNSQFTTFTLSTFY